ncbi:KH domain-containing protein [Candidatus Saccharibacteria bacterium CPR2]|nr:KH domain-containing protein [Candidatus Saccharibacteria bacterium CPR2]
MATIDEQFVEFIVKSLVGNPDAVSVKRTIDEKGVLLELSVAPDDLGRVIGKRGATAQSIRTLLRALGTKNDARYNLKIVDVGGESRERYNNQESSQSEEIEETKEEDTQQDEVSETEEKVEDVEESTDEPVEEEPDRLKKTRQELEDLDDLEI